MWPVRARCCWQCWRTQRSGSKCCPCCRSTVCVGVALARVLTVVTVCHHTHRMHGDPNLANPKQWIAQAMRLAHKHGHSDTAVLLRSATDPQHTPAAVATAHATTTAAIATELRCAKSAATDSGTPTAQPLGVTRGQAAAGEPARRLTASSTASSGGAHRHGGGRRCPVARGHSCREGAAAYSQLVLRRALGVRNAATGRAVGSPTDRATSAGVMGRLSASTPTPSLPSSESSPRAASTGTTGSSAVATAASRNTAPSQSVRACDVCSASMHSLRSRRRLHLHGQALIAAAMIN